MSVFCQVLNLHRSLLLTCTEEPHAELIHQELKTSACPWRQQAPVPLSPALWGGQLQVLAEVDAARPNTRHVRAPTPA